jgi:hypothetical protein
MFHLLTRSLLEFAETWYSSKRFVEHMAGFSHDAIHVLVGGIAPLLIAWVSRRTLANWLPWLVVLLLIFINEAIDLAVGLWPDYPARYGESAKDLILTMVLPTIFLLTARLKPELFVRR